MAENITDNVNEFANKVSGEVRKLRRSRTDRKLAGVCGGLAEYFGVDATLLRIVLVAATLFGFGAGAVLYLLCWLLVPETD